MIGGYNWKRLMKVNCLTRLTIFFLINVKKKKVSLSYGTESNSLCNLLVLCGWQA